MIDSHTHSGLNEFCKDGEEHFRYDLQNTLDEFVEFMDKIGAYKPIILPIPDNSYDAEKSNKYLHDACLKYPGRFIPLGRGYIY